ITGSDERGDDDHATRSPSPTLMHVDDKGSEEVLTDREDDTPLLQKGGFNTEARIKQLCRQGAFDSPEMLERAWAQTRWQQAIKKAAAVSAPTITDTTANGLLVNAEPG
ncbi:hypothetical protein MPER_03672, partial [Moniliophthora perniciosa FA553]